MSSSSSGRVICTRSQTSSTERRWPARPEVMRIEARVTRRAKRSGRIAASRRPRGSSSGSSSSVVALGRASASLGWPSWRLTIREIRSLVSETSSGGPAILACSPRLKTKEISWREEEYGVVKTTSPSPFSISP